MRSAPSDLRELLVSGAGELGINLTDFQTDSLFFLLAELKKWNRRINLTGIREDRDVIIKHFLDSFSFVKGFAPDPGLKLLDIGTGAGFPALPLKIVFPQIVLTMVESVKKKASFLRHMLRSLGMEGEVFDKRTEEIGLHFHSSFDIVTARALADMSGVLVTGRPFLKSGGTLIMSRGPEENLAEEQWKATGFSLRKREEFLLPHSDFKRAIWSFSNT